MKKGFLFFSVFFLFFGFLLQASEEANYAMAKKHRLIYFYKGTDNASLSFSKTVREFATKYDWRVTGVSADGIWIDGFLENGFDKELMRKRNERDFPVLFIEMQNSHILFSLATQPETLQILENNIVELYEKFEINR